MSCVAGIKSTCLCVFYCETSGNKQKVSQQGLQVFSGFMPGFIPHADFVSVDDAVSRHP